MNMLIDRTYISLMECAPWKDGICFCIEHTFYMHWAYASRSSNLYFSENLLFHHSSSYALNHHARTQHTPLPPLQTHPPETVVTASNQKHSRSLRANTSREAASTTKLLRCAFLEFHAFHTFLLIQVQNCLFNHCHFKCIYRIYF